MRITRCYVFEIAETISPPLYPNVRCHGFIAVGYEGLESLDYQGREMSFIRTIKIFLNARRRKSTIDRVETVLRYSWCKAHKFMGLKCTCAMRDQDSVRYVMYPGCTISEEMFVVGLYDYDGMRSVNELVRAGDVFYDVGANVGPFTMLAAKKGAQVFAFEGHPETTKRLKENFELNDIPVSQAINSAVSEESGEVVFSDGPGSSVNGVVHGPHPAGIRVRSISLDNFAETNPPPTFVKIDTEGHELSVFKGMKNILESRSIKYISFEANGLSSPKELAEMYTMLSTSGYVVGNIDWNAKTFFAKNDLGAKSQNGDYQALSQELQAYVKSNYGIQFVE